MSPQGPLQCRAKSLQPTLTQTKSQRVASIQSLLLDILGCLVALPKCADWLDGRSELQSQMASRCSCRKLHGATCVTNGSAPCQDESGHSGVVSHQGKELTCRAPVSNQATRKYQPERGWSDIELDIGKPKHKHLMGLHPKPSQKMHVCQGAAWTLRKHRRRMLATLDLGHRQTRSLLKLPTCMKRFG